MTHVEELAVVRARLERMLTLCQAASGSWFTEQDLGEDCVPVIEAAFIAAASPDLLLRVAREALGTLDRHAMRENGMCDVCWTWTVTDAWPCPEVASVLRAWQP